VGANLSYHLLLPIGTIAQSEAPAVSALEVMFGRTGGQVAALVLVCSTFGAVNSNMLTGPRIYFAVARDGLLPQRLQHIHGTWKTPANAIMLQTVWTIVLLAGAFAWTSPDGQAWVRSMMSGAASVATATAELPKPDPHGAFDKLTNYAIFGGSAFYALAVAAVFVLRKKRPDLERPYRTWGYPYTPAIYLIAFTGALASLLAQCFVESVVGSVVIIAGVVYYLSVTRRRSVGQM
jgi:APA family basic amino acid/polyamine antiporter